jgi:hypothetical protein
MYLQKPFNAGYNFLLIFKLIYMLEIFLTTIRPIRKKTFNLQIKHKIKKQTYRLTESATYKLLNIKLFMQNKKITIYINIASRKEMYPHLNETFYIKPMILLIKKKLKQFNNNQCLSTKLILTNFIQTTFENYQKATINTKYTIKQNKILKLIHTYRKKSKKINLRFYIKNLKYKKTYKN